MMNDVIIVIAIVIVIVIVMLITIVPFCSSFGRNWKGPAPNSLVAQTHPPPVVLPFPIYIDLHVCFIAARGFVRTDLHRCFLDARRFVSTDIHRCFVDARGFLRTDLYRCSIDVSSLLVDLHGCFVAARGTLGYGIFEVGLIFRNVVPTMDRKQVFQTSNMCKQ